MDGKNNSWSYIPDYKKCFVCGKENEFGLGLSFENLGTEVRTSWIPRKEHCGYENVVHGGIISAVLDEIMGWTAWGQYKKFYWTVEITIRFHKPILAGEKYIAVARLIESSRKIYTAEGEIISANRVMAASGKGKYILRSDIEPAE